VAFFLTHSVVVKRLLQPVLPVNRLQSVHTFEDLCNSADDELFIKIRKYSNHILHGVLPPPSTALQNYKNYSLRQRAHSLLNAHHIFLTVISLCVWCTRTPTRPSHCFLHYICCVDVLGIATDFSSLTFHCIFLVRSVLPYYNKMTMMMMNVAAQSIAILHRLDRIYFLFIYLIVRIVRKTYVT